MSAGDCSVGSEIFDFHGHFHSILSDVEREEERERREKEERNPEEIGGRYRGI